MKSITSLKYRERQAIILHWCVLFFAVLNYPISPVRCATCSPEANVLIPYDQYAHTSKTPISKSVIISIRKR